MTESEEDVAIKNKNKVVLESGKKVITDENFNSMNEILERRIREMEADPGLEAYVIKRNEEELMKGCMEKYAKCGALKKDRDMSGFDKFQLWNNNPNQTKMRDLCLSFLGEVIRNDMFDKVLVLYGNSGTGKTYFALSMLKMLCMASMPPLFIKKQIETDDGIKTVLEDSNIVRFWHGLYTTSEEICNAYYGTDKSSRVEQRIMIDRWKTTKLLVIDEIGRGLVAQNKERGALFNIINARINAYLPTVICTNLQEKEMGELFGEALSTRIASVGVKFCTNGIDNMRRPDVQRWLKDSRSKAGCEANR